MERRRGGRSLGARACASMRAAVALGAVLAVAACCTPALASEEADGRRGSDVLWVVEDAESEAEALADLQRAVELGMRLGADVGAAKEALRAAMLRGWFDLSERLVGMSHEPAHQPLPAENGRAAKLDLTASVHGAASEMKRRMSHLQELLRADAGKTSSGIAPAYEWAQSPTHLFLNIKFAHKLDTPATLGCVMSSDNVTILPERVTLAAECAAKRKRFLLDLPLLKSIDAAHPDTEWSMASVGRASLTLRKHEDHEGPWARLLQSRKKPGNAHVWWAMAEKHEKDNDEWSSSKAAKAKAKRKAAESAKTGADEKAKEAAAEKAGEDAAKAQDAKAADAAAAKEGDAPAAAPEAPPPPSPFDVRRAELEKKARKEKRAAEEVAQNATRAAEADGRARKREAMERARAEKAAIDEETAKARAAAKEELEAAKARIDADLDLELRHAAAQLDGVWPPEGKAADANAGGGTEL